MAGVAENSPTVAERSITRNGRRRSLAGHVSLLLFHPGAFFRLLPPIQAQRQWLWVAVIMLALAGLYAVRTSVPAAGNDSSAESVISDFGNIASPGGGIDPGFIPDVGPPQDFGTPNAAGGGADVATNWSTALVAASGWVVQWMMLAVILGEVSLFNGVRPQFGKNVQIAIWASVPLALMTLLQLVYTSVGGQIDTPGIAGLLADVESYEQMSPLVRDILWSLFGQVTVFWLWSLILIYIGARQALYGRRWAVLITLVGWVLVLVLVPVALGTVNAPDVISDESFEMPIEMPMDMPPMDNLGLPEALGEPAVPEADSEAEAPVRPAPPMEPVE